MDSATVVKPTVMQRLIDRIGNPLEWTYVNKVILILIVQLIVYGSFAIWSWIAMQHPEVLPWYILKSAIFKLVIQQLILCLLYVVMMIVAIWFREKNQDSRLLAYALAIVISAHGSLFAATIGYATNPLTYLSIFLHGFMGLLLFDITFSLLAITTWIVSLGIHFFGGQLGLIRYAPIISDAPFIDGEIDLLWLLWNMGVGAFVTAFMLILCAYVLKRWKAREAQVNELSELMKKMFGRYLSTEVMSSLIKDPSLLELGGERKEVTIMMTDLRGFTALSERLKPEQVVQMLNSYFEVMVETVLKYKGTINEIIGDALLVIFGAPQEMKDQAERAIACSIEMQNAMTKVNKENRSQNLPDLEMGIGINKAEVIVGNIGSSKRSKYTVVGSGVNMASRIESYTVGGQILISDSVFKEAGTKLRIDGEQEVYPKGSETPLKIYEVGGIADQYNLVLEYEDTDLVKLLQHIPFQYSLLGGKHIGKENLKGSIVSLSKKSAEVVIDVSADLLTNLKMSLINVGGELNSKDIYGKIIDQSGQDSCTIRFTSVPPEISSYFHAYRNHASKET